MKKTGVIISSWDDLRKNKDALKAFIDRFKDEAVIILSEFETQATPAIFRDRIKKSFITDTRTLSSARLTRLCDEVLSFDGNGLTSLKTKKPEPQHKTKLGFIVSNGFGLGHVARMQAFAEGLKDFAPIAVMSFSAAWRGDDVLYLPSAQYLELDQFDGDTYTAEAVRQFLNAENPTHVFYDGNVLPSGLLRVLSHHPDIHLTWIRRAMWQSDIAPQYMAQQAMVDLVMEPGDIAQSYDTGPSWSQRNDFCPPNDFLKTPAIKPQAVSLSRDVALRALKLDTNKKYALLMLGASQKPDQVAQAVRKSGLTPVIAHWPISHDHAPKIDGAVVIEQMPIAPYYNAFDVIISAAGYNSFHEILASGIKCIFVPQEDAGRDNQLGRARYAADNGHAYMCRHTDLDKLDTVLEQALSHAIKPMNNTDWLEDWADIFSAIHGQKNKDTTPKLSRAISAPKKLLKTAFKRWRAKNKTYNTRFVVALGMNYKEFSRKIKPSDLKTIVITDSIDPIMLRRGGYKYVWLNDVVRTSRHALFRQFLNWLHVWRPQEMIIL